MPDELASDAGAGGSFLRSRLERGELRLVRRMLRLVGAGEMAHDQPDRDAVEGAQASPQAARRPPAAGRAATCRCRPAASRRAAGRPAWRPRARPRSARCCSAPGSRRPRRTRLRRRAQCRSAHGSPAAAPSAARSASASPRCATKKIVAAFGASAARNLGRAEPIAVGLDDACRSRRRRAALEEPVVLADRPEIDGQNGAGQSR